LVYWNFNHYILRVTMIEIPIYQIKNNFNKIIENIRFIMNYAKSWQQIDTTIKSGDLDKSWKLFMQHILLDSTFNKYIKLLIKYNYLEETIDVFNWAVENKMRPYPDHYCYLLKELIKGGNIKLMLSVFKEIKSKGYVVSCEIHKYLIHNFGGEFVDDLIYDLKTSHICIEQKTLTFLLLDLYQKNKFQKILDIYDVIEKNKLTCFNYEIFLETAIQVSNKELVNKIIKDTPNKKKSIGFHNIVLSCNIQELDFDVIGYLNEMRKEKIFPNESTYFSCILNRIYTNDSATCLELLKLLNKYRVLITSNIYNLCLNLFKQYNMLNCADILRTQIRKNTVHEKKLWVEKKLF